MNILVLVAVIILALLIVVLVAIIRTQRQKQPTGREGMVGKIGKVRTAIDPKGTLLVHGELWEAESESGRIEPGEEVKVTGIEGLKLRVTKI